MVTRKGGNGPSIISVLDGGRCPPALEYAKSGVVLPPNALVLKLKLK